MSLLNQMTGRKPGAVAVVESHAAFFKSRNNAVDDDHAGHLLHQVNQFGIRDHFGVNHQSCAAVADQLFDRLALFLLIMIAIADQ